MALPHVKEVRELGVVHVVEEWRISHDGVDALVRQVGGGRIAAGQVQRVAFPELQKALGRAVSDRYGETKDLLAGELAVLAAHLDLGGVFAVVQRPEDSAFEQGSEGPRAPRCAPDVRL